MTFSNIRNDKHRCANIVNSDIIYKDIENKTLPDYVFYTPNQENDMHNTNVSYGSNWLENFIEPLLKNPYLNDTVFLITFDENNISIVISNQSICV
jgi:phospholipase C